MCILLEKTNFVFKIRLETLVIIDYEFNKPKLKRVGTFILYVWEYDFSRLSTGI